MCHTEIWYSLWRSWGRKWQRAIWIDDVRALYFIAPLARRGTKNMTEIVLRCKLAKGASRTKRKGRWKKEKGESEFGLFPVGNLMHMLYFIPAHYYFHLLHQQMCHYASNILFMEYIVHPMSTGKSRYIKNSRTRTTSIYINIHPRIYMWFRLYDVQIYTYICIEHES